MHRLCAHLFRPQVRRIVALFASLMLLTAQSAMAQSIAEARLTVTPQYAPPGVERTLRVDAVKLSGCPTGAATIAAVPIDDPTQLNITIEDIDALVSPACPGTMVPISVEIKYTPSKVGSMNVSVMLSDKRFVGQWPLVTSTPDSVGLLSNLSGTWFERPNPGSILSVTHKAFDANSPLPSRDALVGTFGLFSSAGAPRWYLFHSSKRVAPNILEAELYEYALPIGTTPAWPNPCPITACPMAGFTAYSQSIGKVRLVIDSSDQIRVSVEKPNGTGILGLPRDLIAFQSVMTRFAF